MTLNPSTNINTSISHKADGQSAEHDDFLPMLDTNEMDQFGEVAEFGGVAREVVGHGWPIPIYWQRGLWLRGIEVKLSPQ